MEQPVAPTSSHLRSALAALTALAAAALPAMPAHAALPGSWAPQPVPAGPANLAGVAAISPSDVWAVGAAAHQFGGGSDSHAVHFDGHSWSPVKVPDLPSSQLDGVDAAGAGNVWAVGTHVIGDPESGRFQRAYVVRLTGDRFEQVPAPTPGRHSVLTGIDMRTPTDGWAAGYYELAGGERRALLLHWDGVAWSQAHVPHLPGGQNVLTSVSAYSADGAVAVGHYTAGGAARGFPSHTLALRWDGERWAVSETPNPNTPAFGGSVNSLRAVLALSPTDVWAAGQTSNNPWASLRPLALHWDGTAWAEVQLNSADPDLADFTGIAAVSPDEVYFSGHRTTDRWRNTAFVQKWNGAAFSPEAIDPPTRPVNQRPVSALGGIAALPSGHVWTVGHEFDSVKWASTGHVLARTP
jgi:hypothetical protein